MEVFEMSKRTNKAGIEIGSYLIRPLGIAAVAALAAVIAFAAVFFLRAPASEDPQKLVSNNTPIPTEEAIVVTTEPTETPIPTETPEVTPTPEPTATPIPALRSATIRSLGEIAIETDLLTSAMDSETGTFDFSPMFEMISDSIGNADYTVADVEGTLGGVSAISGNGATMCTPTALLDALKACGVDMLMLANDHILDGTAAELTATMANITAAGMDYVGAYNSQQERDTAVIREINGIQVGFLAYTESVNGNESKLDSDARKYAVSMTTNSNPQADVNRLRTAGADVIVVYMNWGEMFSRSLGKTESAIAQMLASLGVDVIIGYNPHTVQPVGWLTATLADGTEHKTLMLCATGNMLSNQRTEYYDNGVIFQFTIQEQSDGTFAIESPAYVPTYVWRYEDAERSTESGKVYQYRVMPIAKYASGDDPRLPAGMDNNTYQYMGKLLTQIQSSLNTNVAAMLSE